MNNLSEEITNDEIRAMDDYHLGCAYIALGCYPMAHRLLNNPKSEIGRVLAEIQRRQRMNEGNDKDVG